LRLFSQRFRPTDFYETDRTPECRIAGLDFQKLPFGWSDAEQESHSGWIIINPLTNRGAMPLFEARAIAIHRAHQTIGAGTYPRASCFPPTFVQKRHPTQPYGFMTRLLATCMPIFRSSALLYDRMHSIIRFIESSSPSRGALSSFRWLVYVAIVIV
jgi:hypothetical protein